MTASDTKFTHNDGINLREYFESKLIDMKLFYDAKLEGISTSTRAAANSMEKRLDGMNEFRDALKDAQTMNVTIGQFDSLSKTVDTLMIQSSRFIDRDYLSIALGRLEADIRILNTSKDKMEGKASQMSVIISIVLAVAGLAVSIVMKLV